jgi:glycerophosphoryl diester phosphodiesterase
MTKIIAHRGASQAAPENTLAAVNLAWSWGVDAVEVDVHLSGDGQLAVIHDTTTMRTTGTDLKVGETPMAELAKLDAGWCKPGRYRGEPVPTLAQVLATVPDGKGILVEVKEKDRERVLPVLEADLKSSWVDPARVVVMAFDYELVKLARRRLPAVHVWWLYGDYSLVPEGEWPAFKRMLINHAQAADLHGLNLGQHHQEMNAEFISQIHAAGLESHFWTVDSPAKARELILGEADSITTNLPDWVLGLRAQLFGESA